MRSIASSMTSAWSMRGATGCGSDLLEGVAAKAQRPGRRDNPADVESPPTIKRPTLARRSR